MLKLGDKVRALRGEHAGETGELFEIMGDGYLFPYCVKFSDGDMRCFKFEEIENV